jgi:hypothetical protein
MPPEPEDGPSVAHRTERPAGYGWRGVRCPPGQPEGFV